MLVNSYLGSVGAAATGFYRSITVDHTKLGSSDLTNFPVFVTVTDTNLKTVANGGHVDNTAGILNIWVATTTTGATKVPFQIAKYDGSAGTLSMWVLGASVSHTVDTLIGYLRYGDPAVTTDQSNAAGTFTAFRTVAHTQAVSGSSTAISGNDSTGNALNWTLTSSPTAATGQLVAGANVGGSGSTSPGGSSLIGPRFSRLIGTDGGPFGSTTPTAYSYSFWWNAAGAPTAVEPRRVVWIASGSGSDVGGFSWSHDNATFRQAAYHANSSVTYFAVKLTSTLSGSTWYRITVEWTGSSLIIYLNGSSEATAAPASIKTTNSTDTVTFGGQELGVLEEIRTATVALGASWALADYNNGNSPATFTALGTETAI